MLQEFGEELYPICHIGTPLWMCYSLWGFEGMMTMIASRPDLVERACGRFTDRAIHQAQVVSILGAAGVWLEECLTDMVSPAAFARFNAPCVRRLVEAIRNEGMHSIYYYCGDPAGKWEHLLAAGADALSLEESKKGFEIDIENVVDRVQGRCAVLGNLDAMVLLQEGTEAELRREIERQIRAGRRNGSRFVLSIGSPVTPATPVERVRLYCDLAHESDVR
jgi:uroporphyrinogen-III decarboxylase